MAVVKGSEWGGSRMTCAQTCKQKYFYEYEYPHESGGTGLIMLESKIAPLKGTIIHAGLQNFYELKKSNPDMLYADRILHAIKAALDAMKELNVAADMIPLLRDEVIACLDQYAQKYEVEDMEVLYVEQPITIKIGELVHTGIVDLVARWHGHLVVPDHKTTSMQLPFLFKKLRFDLSLKGYAIAMQEIFGEPVHVLINGIRFKGTKSLECEFDRELIMYNEAELAEFPRTIQAIRREIDMCREDNFWPKSGAQCVQIWGECDYRKICTYPDPSVVKTFYKPRREA